MFKITIVSGSQRANSQSAKVAGFIRGLVDGIGGIETYLLDLGATPLSLWTDDPAAQAEQDLAWRPIAHHLRNSEAIVFVTPEWNGMATPAIKNFFLYCTSHELADRPAMIVGVSSGAGGASPASELRLSSYKDTQVCYIPEQVIVRGVREMLNSFETAESETDAYIRYRLDYALRVLVEYGKALTEVRRSNVRRFADIPYGM